MAATTPAADAPSGRHRNRYRTPCLAITPRFHGVLLPDAAAPSRRRVGTSAKSGALGIDLEEAGEGSGIDGVDRLPEGSVIGAGRHPLRAGLPVRPEATTTEGIGGQPHRVRPVQQRTPVDRGAVRLDGHHRGRQSCRTTVVAPQRPGDDHVRLDGLGCFLDSHMSMVTAWTFETERVGHSPRGDAAGDCGSEMPFELGGQDPRRRSAVIRRMYSTSFASSANSGPLITRSVVSSPGRSSSTPRTIRKINASHP